MEKCILILQLPYSNDIQQYYDSGYKDVSPGYIAKTTWFDSPMTYKGIPYQIIMSDISE